MNTVIGLAGSLRKGSFNAALLRAAAQLAPDGLRVEVATIAGIPLYDGDEERESGIPETVAKLKQQLADASGLLLVSPEYNNSLPGVAKNAIDWMSRPANDIARVFGDKYVGLIGATPGRGGTRLGQNAWLPVFRTLGMKPFFGQQLYIAEAGKVFDKDGELIDPTVRELLGKFMNGFAKLVAG